jgi:hypothetical protein
MNPLRLVEEPKTVETLRTEIRTGRYIYREVNDLLGRALDQRLEYVSAEQEVPAEVDAMIQMLLRERSEVMAGRPLSIMGDDITSGHDGPP